jgi:hypothetical protein
MLDICSSTTRDIYAEKILSVKDPASRTTIQAIRIEPKLMGNLHWQCLQLYSLAPWQGSLNNIASQGAKVNNTAVNIASVNHPLLLL